MLKWAGIFLIMAGAAGMGGYLSACLKQRLNELVECREIFVQMDAGREYLHLPYAELLRRTAKGKTAVFSSMLLDVAEEMEKNRQADAGMLWAGAFTERKHQLLLGEEEIEIMSALAKSLMLEGSHREASKIYLMQLEDKILQAIEEKKEKQRLYGMAGVSGGLFLVILLL